MPTYDYKCQKCDKTTQIMHKMCEEITQSCPECNVNMVKQIGTGCGLHFKGTGFYATDYKGK